jgi:hypothetical protein
MKTYNITFTGERPVELVAPLSAAIRIAKEMARAEGPDDADPWTITDSHGHIVASGKGNKLN